MKYISVFCAAKNGRNSNYKKSAKELGKLLVNNNFGLVYGGTNTGLMGDIAEAFIQAGGKVIGVILSEMRHMEEVPKNNVELIEVDSYSSRKAKMIEISAGAIVLAGGISTLDELTEFLIHQRIAEAYGHSIKPCALLNLDNFFNPLLAQFKNGIDYGFSHAYRQDWFFSTDNLEALVNYMVDKTQQQKIGIANISASEKTIFPDSIQSTDLEKVICQNNNIAQQGFFKIKRQSLVNEDCEQTYSNEDSQAIFSAFPGDFQAFLKKLRGELSTSDFAEIPDLEAFLEAIIKAKLITKEQAFVWQQQLWRISSDTRYHKIIGMLSLYAKINNIALLLDGNGRWAKMHKLHPSEGHRMTFEKALPAIIGEAFQLGVHSMTIGLGKPKHFTRNKDELMQSTDNFYEALLHYLEMAKKFGARISIVGHLDAEFLLDSGMQSKVANILRKLAHIEKETSHFTKHQINLVFNYDMEDEIHRIITRIDKAKVPLSEINREKILKYTDTAHLPYPTIDLLIVSANQSLGGRTDSFLPFATKKAHIFFTPQLAPDLDISVVCKAAASSMHPMADYHYANRLSTKTEFLQDDNAMISQTIKSKL